MNTYESKNDPVLCCVDILQYIFMEACVQRVKEEFEWSKPDHTLAPGLDDDL